MKIFFILICLFGCAQQGKLARVCLEGHTYFNYGNKMALKVDDNGHLIKCTCKTCELDFAQKMGEETKALVDSATAWLMYLDQGNIQKNWDSSSFKFKKHTSRRSWVRKMRKQYRTLGRLSSRRPFDALIRGNHGTVMFNADYLEESHVRDTVHMVKEDGQWKGIGFKSL